MFGVAVDDFDAVIPETLCIFGVTMRDYGELVAALCQAYINFGFWSYTIV